MNAIARWSAGRGLLSCKPPPELPPRPSCDEAEMVSGRTQLELLDLAALAYLRSGPDGFLTTDVLPLEARLRKVPRG